MHAAARPARHHRTRLGYGRSALAARDGTQGREHDGAVRSTRIGAERRDAAAGNAVAAGVRVGSVVKTGVASLADDATG